MIYLIIKIKEKLLLVMEINQILQVKFSKHQLQLHIKLKQISIFSIKKKKVGYLVNRDKKWKLVEYLKSI
jgi:hypothetical protein